MAGKLIYNKSAGYCGWIGNMILAHSSAIGIARKNGLEPVFADTGYYDKNFYSWFKGSFNLMSVEELAKIECLEITEPHFHYHDFVLDSTKNYNRMGYFQSEKYWRHCEDEIRGMFEFSDEVFCKVVMNNHKNLQPQLKDIGSSQLTSIHVRRGDYLKYPDTHPVMPMGYYNKAIQTIDDNKMIFLVFSDDIAWCKENFTHKQYEGRIFFVDWNTPVQDLCFISKCANHIICNSTFGLVGSYLCSNKDKKIVAPKKENWFGEARKTWNVNDLYMDNWILI
jgi:hypothetical protein